MNDAALPAEEAAFAICLNLQGKGWLLARPAMLSLGRAARRLPVARCRHIQKLQELCLLLRTASAIISQALGVLAEVK